MTSTTMPWCHRITIGNSTIRRARCKSKCSIGSKPICTWPTRMYASPAAQHRCHTWSKPASNLIIAWRKRLLQRRHRPSITNSNLLPPANKAHKYRNLTMEVTRRRQVSWKPPTTPTNHKVVWWWTGWRLMVRLGHATEETGLTTLSSRWIRARKSGHASSEF